MLEVDQGRSYNKVKRALRITSLSAASTHINSSRPDGTTIGRFRNKLLEKGRYDHLLNLFNQQVGIQRPSGEAGRRGSEALIHRSQAFKTAFIRNHNRSF